MARKKTLENKGKQAGLLENKGAEAPEEPKAPDGMVRVRVLPQRGIGGVGGPGTVAQMERALAEGYAGEGYVEILESRK